MRRWKKANADDSLKRSSHQEMQLVLRVERKYTHNIHLFVIKYINIILSNLLIPFSGSTIQKDTKSAGLSLGLWVIPNLFSSTP
jgi:hypothetical protein